MARRAPGSSSNLPDAVFTGQITGDDLAVRARQRRRFLNPSITEAFGNVTLEAMACALPVIAADATGATNLVRDGVTGTLVDASDIDGFADALEAYARDPELRRRHGEAGLAFAKTMDWDRSIRPCFRSTARDHQAPAAGADDRAVARSISSVRSAARPRRGSRQSRAAARRRARRGRYGGEARSSDS